MGRSLQSIGCETIIIVEFFFFNPVLSAVVLDYSATIILSLPQLVNFLSLEVHKRACKPEIFWTRNKPVFSTAHFNVNTPTSGGKEATGSQFLHFIPQHIVDACTAVKGLMVRGLWEQWFGFLI